MTWHWHWPALAHKFGTVTDPRGRSRHLAAGAKVAKLEGRSAADTLRLRLLLHMYCQSHWQWHNPEATLAFQVI
jgi:hypothetical protein